MPPNAEARLAALLATPWLRPVLAALPGARLVGGCVRDALAGLAPADIDLATPDPPERVIEHLAAAGLRALPTGLAHGTVTALSDGHPVEVTTLRRDTTTDGRHAEVTWTPDWREDAARRDFTINALSLSADGQVHDYFAGQADLAAGRLRFVGEPPRRIAEDTLRILRFFRFLARFGRDAPDAATLAAIQAGVPGLARLSPERVWSELKRLLEQPRAGEMAALMQATAVLDAILPNADPDRLRRLVALGAPADPILRLAALTPEPGLAVARRLNLSNAERDRLIALGAPPLSGLTDPAELRRLRTEAPASLLAGRAWLGGDPELAHRLLQTPQPLFPLEGRDVLALGVPPGPAVGKLLAAVRHWWLTDGAEAPRAACLIKLEEEFFFEKKNQKTSIR